MQLKVFLSIQNGSCCVGLTGAHKSGNVLNLNLPGVKKVFRLLFDKLFCAAFEGNKRQHSTVKRMRSGRSSWAGLVGLGGLVAQRSDLLAINV